MRTAWHADGRARGSPGYILVIREAELAADLITGLIAKPLEQNLSALQTVDGL